MDRQSNRVSLASAIGGRGFWVFVTLAAVLFAVTVVVAVYLDRRLAHIEDRLSHVPLRSYVSPNLDDYPADDFSAEDAAVSRSVYVPVYSHIYYQGGSPFLLETTLSVRNVNTREPVFLTSVEYFDTSGNRTKTFVDRTIKLDPLETIEFLVEARDTVGGSGANFLVHWAARRPVNDPLVESVMVGTAGTQAICFSRTGINLRDEAEGSP